MREDLTFLFAFSLAHVVLELGAHGLRLVEEGADVGLDGHFFLPAAHGSEWRWGGQLCGAVGVCRTVEYGMGHVDEGITHELGEGCIPSALGYRFKEHEVGLRYSA